MVRSACRIASRSTEVSSCLSSAASSHALLCASVGIGRRICDPQGQDRQRRPGRPQRQGNRHQDKQAATSPRPWPRCSQLDSASQRAARDGPKYIDVELTDGSLLHCASVHAQGQAGRADAVCRARRSSCRWRRSSTSCTTPRTRRSARTGRNAGSTSKRSYDVRRHPVRGGRAESTLEGHVRRGGRRRQDDRVRRSNSGDEPAAAQAGTRPRAASSSGSRTRARRRAVQGVRHARRACSWSPSVALTDDRAAR